MHRLSDEERARYDFYCLKSDADMKVARGIPAMADVELLRKERARYEWDLFGPDEDVACGTAVADVVELDVEAVAVDNDITFTDDEIRELLESMGYHATPGGVGYTHGPLDPEI